MINWAELSSLEVPPIVELVDIYVAQDEIFRLCSDINEKGKPITWRGVEYTPIPMKLEGFELTSDGPSTRPSVSVANIQNVVTMAVEQYNQLAGKKIIRRLVLATALDAVNFVDGNPNQDFTKEKTLIYTIERLVTLDTEWGKFELAAPSEMDGAIVPARPIIADICQWKYRQDGCGYTGKPCADQFDEATTDPKQDYCSHTLRGCKIRWGETAVLPFGGFPSVDKVLS